MQSSTRALLVLAVACLPMRVAAQQPATDAPCPDGRSVTGDLGIGGARCVGGACAIHVRDDDGPRHEFSTEPSLFDVRPDGPSAGIVREGDVLVAIDRQLVTTPAGGRKLARLEPGVPVELWLRRDGHDLRVEVTPVAGCGLRSLRVSGGPR